jgi:hypothetical protein
MRHSKSLIDEPTDVFGTSLKIGDRVLKYEGNRYGHRRNWYLIVGIDKACIYTHKIYGFNRPKSTNFEDVSEHCKEEWLKKSKRYRELYPANGGGLRISKLKSKQVTPRCLYIDHEWRKNHVNQEDSSL